jgi:hypothetical protein
MVSFLDSKEGVSDEHGSENSWRSGNKKNMAECQLLHSCVYVSVERKYLPAAFICLTLWLGVKAREATQNER